MDALTHWQIVFPNLCTLLTCPMAPVYYSMNFVIPQEQPDVPISREAASCCIRALVTLGNQQGSVLQQSLFWQAVCQCGSHVGSANSRTFSHFPAMVWFLVKWQRLRLNWNPNRLAAAVGGFPLHHAKSHLPVHFRWQSGLKLMIKRYAGEAFLSFFRRKERESVLFEGQS